MDKLRSLSLVVGLAAYGAGLGNLCHTQSKIEDLATTPDPATNLPQGIPVTSAIAKLFGVEAREKFQRDSRIVEIREHGLLTELRPTRTAIEDWKTELGDIILATYGALVTILSTTMRPRKKE